jgi:hypothetical protein
MALQARLDAHSLWLIQRTVRESSAPERVRIVDAGRLDGNNGRPRYRLKVIDQAAPPAQAD